MMAKSQYEAALRMCDWEWASKVEPELTAAKTEYEKSQTNPA